MKRLKFLPSVLMLVACIAVLCVGIYAVSPVNNEITGTLTITSMAKVSITAYADDVEIFSSTKTASGLNMNLTKSGALDFDAFNVATADEIPLRIIRINIQNLSNKELGAYFYNGVESTLQTEADGTKLATYASLVHESKIFPQGTDATVEENSVADVIYSTYTYIAANDSTTGGYDEVDMYITIDITKIDYEDFVCDFACKLRIEEYRANVTGETYTSNTYDLVKISSKIGETTRTTVPTITNDSKAGTVVMPTTITSLSTANFYNCTGLKHIIIPPSVSERGVAKWAFDSTPYLKSISFSNPGTVCSDSPLDMGFPMMFSNNYNYGVDLDDPTAEPIYPYSSDYVRIYTDSAPTYGSSESYHPKTLKTLYWNYSGDFVLFNANLFYSDDLPVEHIIIGNNVTTFAETFVPLSNLKKLTIPANVTKLSGNFTKLTNLTAVKFCATNMADLDSARFPSCVKTFEFGETVTKIPAKLCQSLTELTQINIPDSVTSIGGSAFMLCSNMVHATIGGGISQIGSHIFSDCYSLTNVVIKEGTSVIGDAAFYFCNSLSNISIPNTVRSIGGSAFNGCAFTSLELPEGIVSIGEYAFESCTNLTSIIIPASVNSLEYLGDSCGLISITIKSDGVNTVTFNCNLHTPDTGSTFKGWSLNGNVTNLVPAGTAIVKSASTDNVYTAVFA